MRLRLPILTFALLATTESAEAESWFMKSAEQGYAPAERALGMLY